MDKKQYSGNDITIVICAYKECEYLGEAVKSAVNQAVPVNVVISTSTPNDYIKGIATQYNLPVWVNTDGGHAKDYNFAIKQTPTDICIMFHQDDVYSEDFVKKSLEALNTAKDPIIAFTNYKEIHDGEIDKKDTALVKIKRILLIPINSKKLRGTVFGKRLILRFGDPICHPSTIYVKNKMPEEVFRDRFISAMDWDFFERVSKTPGEFVYVKDVLFFHRMHKETATTKVLENTNNRYTEEIEIFNRFWPMWIAKIIKHFYSKSNKYY